MDRFEVGHSATGNGNNDRLSVLRVLPFLAVRKLVTWQDPGLQLLESAYLRLAHQLHYPCRTVANDEHFVVNA